MATTQAATDERLVIEITAQRKLEAVALRAYLKATDLLGFCVGKVVADCRAQGDPLVAAMATVTELRTQLAATERKLALVQSRLDRIPRRQRPHFTPAARFDVLEVKALLREPAATTARWCGVAVNTILRWEESHRKEPTRRTIGSLLKAIPPVRRFADAERRLVQWMDHMGFPGAGTIAATLARAGRKLSRRTIARIRKEKRLPTPPSPPQGRLVQGRYPNHVWIADETHIPCLFRIFSFKLLLIIDVFSRFPVAARGCPSRSRPLKPWWTSSVTRLLNTGGQGTSSRTRDGRSGRSASPRSCGNPASDSGLVPSASTAPLPSSKDSSRPSNTTSAFATRSRCRVPPWNEG